MRLPPIFALLAALFLVSCATPGGGGKADEFDRGSLIGVWEAVDYEQWFGQPTRPGERRMNEKYCFGQQAAFRGLAPDVSNDSADGLVPWQLTGDLIVFDFPTSPVSIRIGELSSDRLQIYDGGLRITLRRVTRFFDDNRFETPILAPRSIPVRSAASGESYPGNAGTASDRGDYGTGYGNPYGSTPYGTGAETGRW